MRNLGPGRVTKGKAGTNLLNLNQNFHNVFVLGVEMPWAIQWLVTARTA